MVIVKKMPQAVFQMFWNSSETVFSVFLFITFQQDFSFIFYKILFKKSGKNDRISKFMYDNVNRKVEQLSQILYILLVKLDIPGCVLPPFIATMVNYYIYDLGDESFYLGAPAM